MTKRHSSLTDRQRWLKQRLAAEHAADDLREVGVHVFEKHYTARELAEIWALDETTVRRIFQDEPGVLKIGQSGRRDGKRDYVSIRIPKSIAERVHRERSK